MGPGRLGRQSPLNTSPQLGVNNDSVQVGLYCFWLWAFYRNNCNSCQGSFCPQLRGKNKGQRWECLHLILVPRNTQEGQQAWLPTGMGQRTAASTHGCANRAIPLHASAIRALSAYSSHGAFAFISSPVWCGWVNGRHSVCAEVR